jgi:hypothetical protein
MNEKLDTARVFERIFEIYRDQFTLLIPAALVLFLPVALLTGLLFAGTVGFFEYLIILIVSAIAGVWYQGTVVEAARDILDGRRDHTLGSVLRSVTPVIVPLAIAGILAGVATGIGFVLLIVPGLFLLTIWAVIAPVIVIERVPAMESFGRSRELVRGNGWQVFGVVVVVYLLQVVTSLVLRSIANSVADSFATFAVAELLVRLLVAPLSALAAAVLFFELKARRGEPVLATGDGGQIPPTGEPAGGPAPTPAEPPAPAAPPSTPEAPPPPAGPTTGTEEGRSGPPR